MRPRIGFIISLFLFAVSTSFVAPAQQKDCRKMDITVDVTPSSNGKGGIVKVTTNDNDLKFTLHLFSAGGKSQYERVKITNGVIENVPAGTYDLMVQSKNRDYCSETRTVTVN